MKHGLIAWQRASLSKVKDNTRVDFFTFVKKGEPVFVGYICGLSLADEVNQTLWMFDLKEKDVDLWVGRTEGEWEEYVDKKIQSEMIYLMINNIKPALNIEYQVPINIRINELYNYGCPYLPPIIKN